MPNETPQEKQNAKELKKIFNKDTEKYDDMYNRSRSIMHRRTVNFDYYDKIAHMMNLYDANDVVFSEGTTQSIERKIRAQTIQRVPDGELVTQFDKDTIEAAELEYIFKNKILQSEVSGKDMLKNLWRTFDYSYLYGFACVRTGFEKDSRGDICVSYTEIPYSKVFPDPDCEYIEEAEWYIIDEMVSRSFIKNLLNDNNKLYDKTYNQDTIDYILKHEYFDADSSDEQHKIQDTEKGITKTESVRVRTLYRKGNKEFISYIPGLHAEFRKVKNYDPKLELPIHFLILEPDPSFPLGASSLINTISKQQYADAFQSTAYQQLLLSLKPPLMGWGNLTPTSFKMAPGAYWNLGTNQNNKVEKFAIETTTITQYASILEQISASMNKSMNIMDQTVASDAHTEGWSKTAQGVQQQAYDKTITVNQYQKRIEIFFSEWANHAIRSYIASMKGTIALTVDEETRRRIFDVEDAMNQRNQEENKPQVKSIIEDNKINIDFNKLSADRIIFNVRTGSLMLGRKDQQRESIQEMLVSVSQMMGNISENNRQAFEDILLQSTERLIELSDIEFSATAAKRIDDKLLIDTMFAMAEKIKSSGKAIQQLQQIAMQNAKPNNQLPKSQQSNEVNDLEQYQKTNQLPQEQEQPAQEQISPQELSGDAVPFNEQQMSQLTANNEQNIPPQEETEEEIPEEQ